jgi:hypothetical protein
VGKTGAVLVERPVAAFPSFTVTQRFKKMKRKNIYELNKRNKTKNIQGEHKK